MRKKILSGMLMVAAMLFATSVFTSCKDSYTDDIAEVKGVLKDEMAKLKKDLQDQIDALKAAQAACKTNCEAVQKDLQDQIDALKTALAGVKGCDCDKNLIAALKDGVQALNDEVAALKAQDVLLNNKIQVLETKLANIDLSQVEQNKADIATLFTTVNNLTTLVNDAKAAAEAVNTLAQTAKDDAAAAQVAANEAKTAAAKAQTAADEAQAQADENATKIATIDSALTGLTTKVNSLETKINDLTSDVAKAQAQADAALALAKEDSTRIDALQTALNNIPPYNGYTKEEVDAMKQELEGKIAENKMAIEDAAKVADDAYELAKKAYDLADDAKTIALQALNNAAINAQDIKDINDYLDYIIPALQDKDQDLQDQIDDINNVKLPALANDIADLQNRMGIVEQAIEDLKEDLAKKVEALKKQITGIIVQGTYNPVFGQFSLPGVNSTMLCALYGSYTEADTKWPADVIDLTNISKAKTLDLENGQDLVSDGNKAYAGKLYLTVNPAEANFSGVDFTLETSAGNQSPYELGKLKKSTDELTFGWTRAGVSNFYESKAYVKVEDFEDVKLTKNINIDELKNVAKDLLNGLKGGNGNLPGALNTLCSSLNGFLPAYAAKVSVEDPTLGTTTIVSNYNIAATAWKPLSFEFLKGKTFSFPTISPLDLTFNMHLQDPEYPSLIDANFYIVVDPAYSNTVYGFFATEAEAEAYNTSAVAGMGKVIKIDKLTDQINAAIAKAVDNVKELQDEIAQQASDNFDNAMAKVNDQIIGRVNNLINKFASKFNNLNQYLLPTVLYQSDKGWAVASTVAGLPTPAEKGIVELNVTTYTNEIFAPAYKKFVAVTNFEPANPAANAQNAIDAANNKLYKMAKVIDGSVKQVYCQFTEPGVYEVSFAALDYSGKTVVTKHYFKVN
ncbi:MAG: hypothetical protein Q4A08_06085 [Bacteroidales bacterium]|nr:hypothetical protein [Bacteroidales bacterium]